MDSNWFSKQKLVEERRRQNMERKELADKKKLKTDVRKKLMTTMIGAIDIFEKNFGYLWGIDKEEADLTEEEIRLGDLWEDARSAVLDKGHMQINAIMDELENYDITWNGYKYQFIVKD